MSEDVSGERLQKVVTIWSQYGVSPCATTLVLGSILPSGDRLANGLQDNELKAAQKICVQAEIDVIIVGIQVVSGVMSPLQSQVARHIYRLSLTESPIYGYIYIHTLQQGEP